MKILKNFFGKSNKLFIFNLSWSTNKIKRTELIMKLPEDARKKIIEKMKKTLTI